MDARDIDNTEIEATASGDALLQHADWLRRLARSLVQDAAESDDLVQETWLAALRARAVDGRPLKPWLNTVARNFSKRSFRRRERPTADPAQGEIDPGLPDPSDVAEKLEAERRLTEALSTLEEPFRSTLFLRFYEDLSSPEIANRTDSPAGTVRWRLKRGLELLRERLDGDATSGSWLALLLPLAASGSSKSIAALALTAGTTTSPLAALFGAIAMNTMIKAIAAALVLTLVYVGLDSTAVLPKSVSLRARTSTEAAMEVPGEMARVEPADSRIVSLEPTKETEPQRSAVAGATEAAAKLGHAEPTDEGPWLSARLIDDQGRPLSGVVIAVEGVDTDERSDIQGRIRANLEGAPEEMHSWTIAFMRDGYATHQRREKREEGVDLELGEIVMEPGGSIRGRVVDETGLAVAGARIDFMAGVFLPRQLESMRFQYRRETTLFTESDETGAFHLEGVSPGSVRLWAVTERDHLPGFSKAVEVRAGMTEQGVVITLLPLPPEHRIQLRVYDPSGEPAADARVDYSHTSPSEGVSTQSTSFTDEEGRLEFAVFADAVLTGQVVDAEEACSPALIGPLTTGLDEVRIDLTGKQYSHFVVRDDDGNRVNEFSYEVRSADGETVLHREGKELYLPGGTPPTFAAPSSPYEIWVYAPMFEVGQSGPVDPKSSAQISVRLEKVPGMHGRVLTAEGPLTSARVSLHRSIDQEEEYKRNNFRCRYDPSALDSVRTDAEGRFILTVREPGEYVVRADADGFAAADTVGFEIAEDLAGEGVELLLQRGGAIEGRVLSQESSADNVVGISRGDGYNRTTRVSESGSFRFEGLTPGPWRVRLRETEINPTSTTISSTRGGQIKSFDSLKWDCDVMPGETTYFNVDPIGRAAQVFTGQLILEEGSPSSWSAELLPEGAFFPESDHANSVPLDGDGRFEIACDEVGPRVLVLRSAGVGANELYLTEEVNTESNPSWSFEFRSGSVVFSGAPPGGARGAPQLVMKVSKSNGVEFWATVIGDENGRCEVRAAPIGNGTLVRPDFTTFPEFHPEAWPILAEFTVSRGSETLVEIPN